MTTSTCWNDPRIRSREKSDFVLKYDKLNNPRAMSQKKYNETLQQMGEYGPTCHVQSVYNVCNQKDVNGRDVLRLVELKSGKLVIPLEDVFDEIERIHLQHNHLCNIAKFYQAIKESTNLATGNISFEMAKDFISRCQTCTIKSQQKSSKTSQNTGLFAPKLSPTKFPKKNARPEISPILLSNGASNSGGSGGKSDGAKNGSQNGSSNNGQNFMPHSQPSFVAPSPIYTAVNRPFFPTTPLSNQPFSSMTSSSTKDFNKSGWMPTFTSTPLATKAAQPRIDISSTSFLIPQFTPHQNSNTNQLANNCLVNNRSVITTCGPALQTSNAFTQNTTVIISDHPEVPPIREVVQNAVGNASSREPVIKQEVHPIDEMLQKYIDVGEWKNDFIFTDTECRQILGELARTHFGMWELKESRTNPGEFYFFNKKDGTCQWNEPDAWVEEIKKRVSIEKVLRIEQDDENNQLEDEILGEGDIIEQPVEEDNFVVEDPIQRREENVVQSLEPAKDQQPVVENNVEELIASPTQQDLPQQDMEEIVQSLVDDLITERENQILKQPQSAVVSEEEGKKNICEENLEGLENPLETALEVPVETFVETGLEGAVEEASEAALEVPVEGALETPLEGAGETAVEGAVERALETALEVPVEGALEGAVETGLEIPVETPLETPLSAPAAPPALEEPPLNIQPPNCSVAPIEKLIEEENNKICEEKVVENSPIQHQQQQQEEEQPVVMNNGGDETTNFLRPFNTTDSFMAAALGGGLNDDTMDIANFIEQFDEQLNSPPPNNRENVQQVLSNEIVIEKVSAEEVNKNNNNNILPPRPIKYTNQTAKKTIGGGGGGLSFCQFSVTGRKRVNEALKFKPKEEAKPPLRPHSSPRKRPPMFKHAALQRVRISLPDVEKLFKEPEMDCNQLKKAILELEQKILASNKKEQKFTPPSTSSFAQQHQSTSTSSTSFKAKITIKRPVAKRYGKNIDQICSTSTGNRRSSSSSSSGLKKLRMKKKKNVVKKAKKNDSSFNSDTSFFHSFGGRRSSTPFLGKDVQLFICIHCPAGSHLKYTNEHDYRLHVLARHRIVTNDCEAIHEYIKKQRFIYIGNLNFYCEDCDKFFDNQQQNALERATEWVVHRLEVHGTEFKENCATIIEKIFASPTHHPYLTIKREKQEILSDNEDNTNDEDDVEWKVYKKRNDEDSSFNPSPKKNGKKRKKMVKKSYSSAGGSGGGGSSVKVKKEI